MFFAALSATFAALAGPVRAQERPGSAYASGGIAFPYQKGAASDQFQTYDTAPGGSTRGWTFTGGVFLSRHVSVEGELAWTGMMRAREPSRYGMTFNEERRDWFFGGNLRFHVGRSIHDLEPVAGLVVTHHQAWSQTEFSSIGPGVSQPTTSSPRTSIPMPTTLGFAAGADARIGGRHVAVVPSFRLRGRFAVFGDNSNFSWYPGGFPHWTVSPAISVRVEY
jgi:hypothetical protein